MQHASAIGNDLFRYGSSLFACYIRGLRRHPEAVSKVANFKILLREHTPDPPNSACYHSHFLYHDDDD